MKKIILLALVLVLLSMSMPGTQLEATGSCSTNRHVHLGQSIQDAVNSAQSGDTIFVHAGTYYENVVVNKTVSLIGENKHTTIIDGGAVQFDVLYVTANNVTVSGFTLQRGGHDGYPDRRGVYLYSSNNNISNNIIRMNVEGIFVCMSNNNIFKNNSIHANTRNGIWLFSSSNNIITGNTIANNGKYGMILQGVCSSNRIFHNNFIRNRNENLHVATTGVCVNHWDNSYPSGGNYWSDYNGTDLFGGSFQNVTGGDGIGDTLHEIDVNNRDNCPLLGIFSDFNATPEYNVQTICNSSISDFRFNGTAINFDVTGEDETTGFCRICIPKALMNYTYKVFVNGTEVPYTLLACSNRTHSYLYFTYDHSTQEVMIVPELPAWTSMLLTLVVLAVSLVVYKRRLVKTPIR